MSLSSASDDSLPNETYGNMWSIRAGVAINIIGRMDVTHLRSRLIAVAINHAAHPTIITISTILAFYREKFVQADRRGSISDNMIVIHSQTKTSGSLGPRIVESKPLHFHCRTSGITEFWRYASSRLLKNMLIEERFSSGQIL